ncbi:MAG: hypothetical protein IPO18_07090 [bacterium]|nr:hypothetical protein [bacterium]
MMAPALGAIAIANLDLTELAWSTWDYAMAGGWVMVPMIIGSIAMWALIIDRLRTFAQLDRDDIEAPAALAVLGGSRAPEGSSGCGGWCSTAISGRAPAASTSTAPCCGT